MGVYVQKARHLLPTGPFTGLDHLIHLADRTASRPLRHTLLRVLQAALQPAAASRPDSQMPAGAAAGSSSGSSTASAAEAALANCDAFLAAGGVQLAVDLLACEPLPPNISSKLDQAMLCPVCGLAVECA